MNKKLTIEELYLLLDSVKKQIARNEEQTILWEAKGLANNTKWLKIELEKLKTIRKKIHFQLNKRTDKYEKGGK